MLSKRKPILFAVGTILILFLIILTSNTMLATSWYQNITKPEDISQQDISTMIAPPLLFPPDVKFYRELPDKNLSQVSSSHLVFVDSLVLEELTRVEVQKISSFIPEETQTNSHAQEKLNEFLDGRDISYEILSSLKYETSNGILLISAARPSQAAQEMNTVLGSQTIQLENGIIAWVSTGISQENMKNRVVFVQDGLIISVAGTFELTDLENIASKVHVQSFASVE